MAEGAVLYEVREDIACITLNSPPLNILTGAMMDEISTLLEQIAGDSSLKAVMLTANGKAFSGGADIGEHHPDQAPGMITSFTRLFSLFGMLELPVVMAVNGAALGGGFELALMADILIATPEASFGQPEIRLGFFPPLAVVRLQELVGQARTIEITATGRIYTAAEMKEIGIVTRIVPGDELEDTLEAVLKDFRRASPLVMRMNIRTIRKLSNVPFDEALQEASRIFLEELMVTEEPVEGIASFAEKRRPEWKNR
ncbi:enoyl-CoA hydratase/isomerase family protein [Gemmatimonadota bacterium]